MSEAISSEVKDNGAVASLLSKRALQRLAEMQHTLTAEMRALTEQHSRFIGALMACDLATQQAMMMEYREQLHTVHTIIAKLRMLLERFSDERDS
ncbi:MAG TPA: hypothetical protein VHL14_07215 [Steroidobacteraceae bacterium]|nr:hypothetical protein [Steroidobacteraceae bacterium]